MGYSEDKSEQFHREIFRKDGDNGYEGLDRL